MSSETPPRRERFRPSWPFSLLLCVGLVLSAGFVLGCEKEEGGGAPIDEPGPWPGGRPNEGKSGGGGSGGDAGAGGAAGTGGIGGEGGAGGDGGMGGGGGTGDGGSGDAWEGCGSAISFPFHCGLCLQGEESCCSALYECSSDPACEAFLHCIDSCTQLECRFNCLQDHPLALQVGGSVLVCLNDLCGSSCRDGGSGGNG